MKDNTTTACVQALTHSWIARFGIPDTITSNRGVQFIGQLWRQKSQHLGFRHHHITAYHPQANGLVKRLHRQLKTALTARLNTPAWTRELRWVLFGLRTMPKEDLGAPMAEPVYDTTLSVPDDIAGINFFKNAPPAEFLQQLRNTTTNFRAQPTSAHG